MGKLAQENKVTSKKQTEGGKQPPPRCTFQILGGWYGRRTGVGVTTVSNSLILGGCVTNVLQNGDKNRRVEGWVTTRF